jgi:oligopeptide/dipeptide ABC transporter ATP-binding protein
MYGGRIMEWAPTPVLFRDMKMPYTEALLQSIPKVEYRSHTKLATIPGRPPNMIDPPKGCRFAPRCRYAQARCQEEEPELTPGISQGHVYPASILSVPPRATRRWPGTSRAARSVPTGSWPSSRSEPPGPGSPPAAPRR